MSDTAHLTRDVRAPGGRRGRKIGSSAGKAGPEIFHILRLSSDLRSKRGPEVIFFCTSSTIRISTDLLVLLLLPIFQYMGLSFDSRLFLRRVCSKHTRYGPIGIGPYLCGVDLAAAERTKKAHTLERPAGM